MGDAMPLPGLVSLSTLVETTAAELHSIKVKPPANGAVMQFTDCEIEVSAVIGADAEGKVKFWVIEAGGGAKYENTQKVTLKFKALEGVPIQALSAGTTKAPLPRGKK